MRPIDDIRVELAQKRIEVAKLVRELEEAYAVDAGMTHASLYNRLGGDPDPKGCAACRGTGIQPGPWQSH